MCGKSLRDAGSGVRHRSEYCVYRLRRAENLKNLKNPVVFAILSLQERTTDYMIEEDWATLEHKFTDLFETFYGRLREFTASEYV